MLEDTLGYIISKALINGISQLLLILKEYLKISKLKDLEKLNLKETGIFNTKTSQEINMELENITCENKKDKIAYQFNTYHIDTAYSGYK